MLKSLFVLFPLVVATFATAQTNILVILADDMGIDTLGLYVGADAGDLPQTETIDRLAREGITFNNAWVTPWCSSTRAALHTGRHGWRTKIGTHPGPKNVSKTNGSRVVPLDGAIAFGLTALPEHSGPVVCK